jgi:TonB-linked SusC/RagA family outer membrane protein
MSLPLLELPRRRPEAVRGRRLRAVSLLAASLLLLHIGSTTATAQNSGPVGGVVVDERGQGVPGATVLVLGTALKYQTDSRGTFRFPSVQGPRATLRIVRIGYRSVTDTVQVGAQDLRFELSQAAITLDEVVVTGTAGERAKREIGNAVTSVDASDLVESSRVPDVSTMINARAPSVEVRPVSGQLGSGPQIRIRGVSTFSLYSQPLIYIDGIRVDNQIESGINVQGFGRGIISRLNDINPEDIESIEIIKGPAAATLYGTEAAQGVIQIITKRGRAGPPEFAVSLRQGTGAFQNPEGRVKKNWGRPLSNRGVVRSDTTIPYPANDQPFQFDVFANEKALGNKIVRTGRLQGYTASLRGGTDASRYFVGLDYDHDNGIEPVNNVRRVSLRANLTLAPTSKFDLAANLGYINGRTNLALEGGAGGIWFSTLFANASANNPGTTAPLGLTGPRRGFWSAPPEIHYLGRHTYQDSKRNLASLTFNYRPTSILSGRLTVGQDQSFAEDVDLLENNPRLIPFFGSIGALGAKFAQQANNEVTTVDGSGALTLSLREGLVSTTTVGLQYYRKFFEFVSATGNRFPAPGLTAVAGAVEQLGQENSVENNTLGMFVQEQVALNDRLFLAGALRVDDNSAFGKDFSFTTYPKASLSWVLDEEPFWKIGLIDAFKLRAAFGAAGRQPEDSAALRTLAPTTGAGGAGALTLQFFGNDDLKPERGREIEVGFEAGLLDSRLGIDFTFYNTITSDAILSRQLAPSLGFPGSQFVNAGRIRNRGVELQLNALAMRSQNLNVDLNLNLSTNSNAVLDLGGVDQGQGFIAVGNQRHVPGFAVGSWFQRVAVSADIDRGGRAINVMCDGGKANGRKLPDGTPLELGGPPVACATAPFLFLGRSVPSFEGSAGTTLTILSRLQVRALADWKTGHYRFDNNLRARCQALLLCEETYYPERFKTAPSHFRNSSGPAYIAEIQSPATLVSHVINDSKFLRLREVSASYDLPQRWVRATNAERLMVNVAARNIRTWTPWTGLDPESQFIERIGTGALEQDNVPQLFQVVMTVNMKF